MKDILVLILSAVLVAVGMVMFVVGLAGPAVNGYRSMRRAQQSEKQSSSIGAKAEG